MFLLQKVFHVEQFDPNSTIQSKNLASGYTSLLHSTLLGDYLARVIAIANQKGGVGKTTTAVNLGASLAVSEQRTLVIDCDPQGNTTSALGFPRDPARRTLYQALMLGEPIERVIIDAQVEGLDLIPSDKNLVGAAVELVSAEEREYRLKALINPSEREVQLYSDRLPSLAGSPNPQRARSKRFCPRANSVRVSGT